MLLWAFNIIISTHELAYSIPMVKRSSVDPSLSPSSTMIKHLLLCYRLANQSQILCEASMGRENDSLFATSGSHFQDGRMPIYGKNPLKIFSGTSGLNSTKLGM